VHLLRVGVVGEEGSTLSRSVNYEGGASFNSNEAGESPMPSKRNATKWSKVQIKEHTKKIGVLVEKLRRESKHEHFVGITTEQIVDKFRRVNSPMMVGLGRGTPTPGGTLSATVIVYNPDPTTANNLVLHLWIGSGAADPNLGTYLSNVDPRFARLSAGGVEGFSIASSSHYELDFSLSIPATMERSTYISNCALTRVNFFDQSTFLDRAAFPFEVI
jgi:hypothetical protein